MPSKKPLKISIVGSAIFVRNTVYEDRAHWGSIPGGYWKKKVQAWEYPKSPFTAYRILHKATKTNQQIEKDKLFEELLSEMKLIRETAHYCKAENAIDLAARYKETAFNTVTTPWPHQIVAAEFTRGRKFAYLAMDMGTGKTLVGINEMYATDARMILIVCPKSVMDVWIDELEKHKPMKNRTMLVLDSGSSTKKAELVREVVKNRRVTPKIIIVNYESFWRGDLGALFLDMQFDLIIYDEIHKLKAAGSRVSRFAARMTGKSHAILGMSGTPFPNGRVDAYGQYRALDPGVFGRSISKFRIRYFLMNQFVDWPEIVGTRNEEEFDKLLGLTMFRVEKSDVMDLPETMTINRFFRLDSESAKIYREMENEFVAYVKAERVTATNALAKMVRLQQITSGFVKAEDGAIVELEDGKRQLLQDILSDEIPRGDPVVVFCKYVKDLAAVRNTAEKLKLRYKELSGAHKDLERGNYPSNCDILGIQVRSGGLGVNLVKSAYCIFYSINYGLGEFVQCRDRLHRGGQTRQVLYIHLLAKDTIDEMVYEAIINKKEIVDAILEKIRQDPN